MVTVSTVSTVGVSVSVRASVGVPVTEGMSNVDKIDFPLWLVMGDPLPAESSRLRDFALLHSLPSAATSLQLHILTSTAQFTMATPLQATYTAPDTSKTIQHEGPYTDGTLAGKTTHLRALQSLVPKLQDEINVYLTARMEEDKKAQGPLSEKEAKEEENYGEEVVEDDA